MINVTVDGKLFKINADLEKMYQQANGYLNIDPEEEGYKDFTSSNFDNTTPEKYKECIDQMIQDIEDLTEKPALFEKMINKMAKKNNGYLKKGAVGLYNCYEQTSHVREEEYCVIMTAIRGKATGENMIDVFLNDYEKFRI